MPRALPLGLVLWASLAIAQPARVLHVRSGECETQHISTVQARRAFQSAVPEIARCYRVARASRPDLEGRVVVLVAIDEARAVAHVMTTSAGGDTPLGPCIERALVGAHWPSLPDHAEVVLPIVLDTTAD